MTGTTVLGRAATLLVSILITLGGCSKQEPAPPAAPNVIDGTGMYVMPGFVNLHAHLGDAQKEPENEYVYTL